MTNIKKKKITKGEWTFDPLGGDWICSECGSHSIDYASICPHCRRRMDRKLISKERINNGKTYL